jgi:hypothetical protein
MFFFQPVVGEVVVNDSEAGEGGAVSGWGVPGADGPVVACAPSSSMAHQQPSMSSATAGRASTDS